VHLMLPVGELKKMAVFRNMSEENILSFTGYFSEKKYKAGEIVFSEGEDGNSMYVVISGEIIIEKDIHEASLTFKELALLSAGNFFGETSSSCGKRSARARAAKDTSLYFIKREDMSSFIKKNPEAGVALYNNIADILTERLRHTSNELALIFDLVKHLVSPAASVQQFLKDAVKEILPYLGDNFNIAVYYYNFFNEEYDKVYENITFGADKSVLPSDLSDGWKDDSNYFMLVRRGGRALACLDLRYREPCSESRKNDLLTIFNTVSAIFASAITEAEHRVEQRMKEKLRRAKL